MDLIVNYYGCLMVGVLTQLYRDLGSAIAARAPHRNGQDTSVAMQACI
jgi:fluoride ion exporter CrcB/FEX